MVELVKYKSKLLPLVSLTSLLPDFVESLPSLLLSAKSVHFQMKQIR